jgi:zinc protease
VVGIWGVLALVLAVGADGPLPARPFESPSDLLSVDSALGRSQQFVLPNGMTVILAPDLEAPVVGMELSYEVGVRDEPEQRPGLASVVQTLMLRQTKHVGSAEYVGLLQGVGGHWKWHTGFDHSFFSATVPSDAIALPLWLWSDQMGFLSETLTDARIAQQVAEIDEDYVRRFENVPLGHLWQMLDQAVYPPGHPYHHAANRPGPALRGLTVAEVRAFVERYYTPDRARLVLSGAFDPARARVLVSRYFATLHAGAAGPRRNAERPVLGRETRLRLAAQVDCPAVTLAWSTPSEFEPDDFALDAVAELLVGHRAGLLRFKLIDELKIATEVSAQEYSRRLGSMFVIKATAAPGHTATDLLAAIDGVLRDAQAKPPVPYLFIGAVTGYVVDRVFGLQTHAARAVLYTDCDEHGVLQSCIETWLGGHLKLSADGLSKAIARQLPLDHRVVIEVVPSPDAPIAGEPRDSSP